MNKFCSVKDVCDFVFATTGRTIDTSYLILGNPEDEMDLKTFLLVSRITQDLYDVRLSDISDFIDQKFKEKYTVTSADILSIISKAVEEKPLESVTVVKENIKTPGPLKRRVGRPKKNIQAIPNNDMYKAVQRDLANGMVKAAVQKKYNLTQLELTRYEGYKYWSDEQKSDHDALLEYRRTHPKCSAREAIEKGCGKAAASYRYALIPTAEQQEEYNNKFITKASPKATIKNGYIKCLFLSDEEQKEQQELYTTIKKIAEIEKRSPREVTTRFIERLKRNYGIVIDQVKKDLMMEYNVGRGEGKAPNALEALAMSKYLPVAKSVVATMLEECKKVI